MFDINQFRELYESVMTEKKGGHAPSGHVGPQGSKGQAFWGDPAQFEADKPGKIPREERGSGNEPRYDDVPTRAPAAKKQADWSSLEKLLSPEKREELRLRREQNNVNPELSQSEKAKKEQELLSGIAGLSKFDTETSKAVTSGITFPKPPPTSADNKLEVLEASDRLLYSVLNVFKQNGCEIIPSEKTAIHKSFVDHGTGYEASDIKAEFIHKLSLVSDEAIPARAANTKLRTPASEAKPAGPKKFRDDIDIVINGVKVAGGHKIIELLGKKEGDNIVVLTKSPELYKEFVAFTGVLLRALSENIDMLALMVKKEFDTETKKRTEELTARIATVTSAANQAVITTKNANAAEEATYQAGLAAEQKRIQDLKDRGKSDKQITQALNKSEKAKTNVEVQKAITQQREEYGRNDLVDLKIKSLKPRHEGEVKTDENGKRIRIWNHKGPVISGDILMSRLEIPANVKIEDYFKDKGGAKGLAQALLNLPGGYDYAVKDATLRGESGWDIFKQALVEIKKAKPKDEYETKVTKVNPNTPEGRQMIELHGTDKQKAELTDKKETK